MRQKTNQKKNKFPWLHSIFPKLLMTFTVITIPILVASFWLNNRAEQITREQIIELASEQMQGNIAQFDEQMKMLNNLCQYVCSNNEEVKMLANLPEAQTVYERGEAMNALNEQFCQIKLVTTIVKDVRIHLKKIEKTVSTTFLSAPMDAEEYGFLMNMPLSGNRVTLYNDMLILFATSAENMNYSPDAKDSSFFLVVELSIPQVMNYLAQGSTDSSVAILLSGDGKFRMSSREDAAAEEIIQAVGSRSDFQQDIITVDGTDYIVLCQESRQTGLKLMKYINLNENFAFFRVYRYWLVFFILLVLAAASLFALFVYRTAQKPINELIAAFRKVEKGDFSVSIRYHKNDEFRYLYHRFDRMVENTKNLIEQVYEQKILSQRSELKQLQSQINPHFLYNSFFIISLSARRGDMEFVESFTAQLGKYFQFIVKNDKDMIPLSEEIAYAKLYAGIQTTRFSNRIAILIEEAPEKYKNLPVPRLILQPLIENALSYGLEKKKENGKLRIYFREEESCFVIYVEDNGEFITEKSLESMQAKLEEKTEGAKMSGLFNIHRRLVIQYGSGSGLSFSMMPEGGLRVKLTIARGEHGKQMGTPPGIWGKGGNDV